MTDETTTESSRATPFLRLLALIHGHSNASARNLGYALRDAIDAAIKTGMPFAPDDLVTASKPRERYAGGHPHGVDLTRWIGETGWLARNWYKLAVECRRTDVMTAIERWERRSRFVWDGAPLFVGAEVDVPQSPRANKRSEPRRLEVTSFRKNGDVEYMVLKEREQRAPWSDDLKCTTCGQWRDRARLPTSKKLIKLTLSEVQERERRRIAVSRMTFEVTDRLDGNRTFEMAGKTFATDHAYWIPLVAGLKVGASRWIWWRFKVTRILCPSVAALDALGAHASRGPHSYELRDVKDWPALIKWGLVAAFKFHDHEDRLEITDAGRERWQRLSPEKFAKDDAAATAQRQIEHEARATWEAERPTREAEEARRRAEYAARWEAERPAREAEERQRREQAEIRTAAQAAERRARLERRFDDEPLFPTLRCTIDDSLAAGNCNLGTSAWIERNAPGKTEMLAPALWALAVEKDDDVYLVENVIRAALVRAKRAGRQTSPEADTATDAPPST